MTAHSIGDLMCYDVTDCHLCGPCEDRTWVQATIERVKGVLGMDKTTVTLDSLIDHFNHIAHSAAVPSIRLEAAERIAFLQELKGASVALIRVVDAADDLGRTDAEYVRFKRAVERGHGDDLRAMGNDTSR